MSHHNNPKYQIPALIESLKAHGLETDEPSQLSDAFRFGYRAAVEASARQLAEQPGFVMVERGALHMVVNALRRDAEQGRSVRGEMADMLLTASPTAPSTEASEPVRAQFQADWESRNGCPMNSRTRDDGSYGVSSIQSAWEAWQAARASKGTK